jgi:hypothetical protein
MSKYDSGPMIPADIISKTYTILGQKKYDDGITYLMEKFSLIVVVLDQFSPQFSRH